MASEHLEHKLALLPDKPGCYLMKNINDQIIYVGKAKNLKNRVRSYFKSSHTGKVAKKMGLVTRRSEQLDKLFDQFAIDPKKPKATKKNDDKKEKDSKDKEKK